MRISDWSSDVCSSDLTMTKPPLTLCLWYEGDAEEAAAFYAETFADSKVGAVNRAPADSPGGKEGDVQTVEFTLFGTRSEEHTSELQSLMRISYAVFCLTQKITIKDTNKNTTTAKHASQNN